MVQRGRPLVTAGPKAAEVQEIVVILQVPPEVLTQDLAIQDLPEVRVIPPEVITDPQAHPTLPAVAHALQVLPTPAVAAQGLQALQALPTPAVVGPVLQDLQVPQVPVAVHDPHLPPHHPLPPEVIEDNAELNRTTSVYS